MRGGSRLGREGDGAPHSSFAGQMPPSPKGKALRRRKSSRRILNSPLQPDGKPISNRQASAQRSVTRGKRSRSNPVFHPVCPLCHRMRRRCPLRNGSGAGTTGLSTRAGPIRTTPVITNRRTIRSSCSFQRFFFWTVHGPFVSGLRAAAGSG